MTTWQPSPKIHTLVVHPYSYSRPDAGGTDTVDSSLLFGNGVFSSFFLVADLCLIYSF